MNSITVLFTRRRWNPISWLIRWAMPRSRFAWSLSSHAIVVADGVCYEATMLHGVRAMAMAESLSGQLVVKQVSYPVPYPQSGIEWARNQVGAGYDWMGALGLSLAPGRDWASEDAWFCYEFAAGVLRAAGGPQLAQLSHVGETALLAVAPAVF